MNTKFLLYVVACFMFSLNCSGDQSPLIDAIDKNDADQVEWLLLNGEDPNALDETLNKKPAIYTAVLMGYTEIVRVLLKYGAKADFVDPLTEKSLEGTAKNRGYKDILRLLEENNKK